MSIRSESLESTTGRRAAGGLLIGLGILALIGTVSGVELGRHGWPLLITGVGAAFFVVMLLIGRGAGALAIPGGAITGVGAILAFQNSFGYFESWSYLWPLVVASVGAGLYIMGLWDGREAVCRAGRMLASVGISLCALFAAFFALGFGAWGFRRSNILFAIALIALGLYLLLRSARGPLEAE
jgi:hypothetical protein